MNETTRQRNDARSSGRPDRPNVELETTTTRIDAGSSGGSASDGGRAAEQAREQARAEAQQTRERAEQAGEQFRQTAAGAGEQIRRQGRETAEMVRRRTAEQAAAVKQMAIDRVNGSKNQFATKISDIGEALRRASDDLENHHDAALASSTRKLAGGIDDVGRRLRESDVNDLVGEVEHFVRRNPGLTLGGLFVAGLAAARFLNAQPPRYQGQSQRHATPTSGAPGGAASTRQGSAGGYRQPSVGPVPSAQGMSPQSGARRGGPQSSTTVGTTGVGNSAAANAAVGTTPATTPSQGAMAGPGVGSRPVGGAADTGRPGDVASTSKAGAITSTTKAASGGESTNSPAGQSAGRGSQGPSTTP